MSFLGSLFGGLTSAIGSIYGANVNAQTQEQINAQNIANQKLFAQNDIQWKVADAKAAGISPLAALGAPEQSFSNVVAPQPGAGFSSAGQSIGRALSAYQSPEDRAAAEQNTALDLQTKQLNNQYIQAKINELSNAGAPPVTAAGAGKGANPASPVDPRFGDKPVTEYSYVPYDDGRVLVGPSRDIEGWSWASNLAKLQYDTRTFGENNLFPQSALWKFLDSKSRTGPAGPDERWIIGPDGVGAKVKSPYHKAASEAGYWGDVRNVFENPAF